MTDQYDASLTGARTAADYGIGVLMALRLQAPYLATRNKLSSMLPTPEVHLS